MVAEVQLSSVLMKSLARPVACLALVLAASVVGGATLEQLTVEEMSQKATAIVRGRVSRCAGETRGSVIYTRCTVSVSERWKGQTPSEAEFVVPGGAARGLVQTFTGTPKFASGGEYVLFLWAGRSGVLQIIGLSQGKFDMSVNKTGEATVRRAVAGGRMLDKTGNPVEDVAVEMTAAELRQRVRRALAGDGQ